MSSLPNSQVFLGRDSGATPLLYPLTEFYRIDGVELPETHEISADRMPEPYRRLLVHDRDMTPTLEAAWGGELHVHAVRHIRQGSVYMRHSLLLLDRGEAVTAMGAISINLDRFPERARRLILEEHVPLGGILRDHGIEHSCRPVAYFRVAADSTIGELLGVETGGELFGRHNVMWDAQEQVLAEVIEILPPGKPPHFAPRKDAEGV